MKSLVFVVAVIVSLTVGAAPDLSTKVGPTIADSGSVYYGFRSFKLSSEDGARNYRVTVCIPNAAVPTLGFPVIYMLDGNAALAALNDSIFETLRDSPQVVVTIGYDTDIRFDVTARAFDYTPALTDGSGSLTEKLRGRRGGGADIFAELIERKIKPKVEKLVKINRSHQALWGHSYGGLFVLNTLFKHPEIFNTYIAADPSIWWERGRILEVEKEFAKRSHSEKSLAVLTGGARREGGGGPMRRGGGRQVSDTARARIMSDRVDVPANAAQDMVKRWTPKLKHTLFHTYPKLSHGPLLPASIPPALRFNVAPETVTF